MIYECEVWHQRLVPERRPFRYRVFMLGLDLADLPNLVRKARWLGHNRFNLFAIHDRDHIEVGSEGGIRANLVSWLSGQGCTVPESARIELVTFPTVLGYGFNPVSFYCVSSNEGQTLFLVAEVVNTFREMKLYLVDQQCEDRSWQRRMQKNFYVSPFSESGDDFHFQIKRPDNQLAINVDNWHGDQKTLVSSVRGEARALTSARLLLLFFKYPLLSLKIITGIHWQALKLWAGKVPFFRKAAHRETQQDVLRPHSSLKQSGSSSNNH